MAETFLSHLIYYSLVHNFCGGPKVQLSTTKLETEKRVLFVECSYMKSYLYFMRVTLGHKIQVPQFFSHHILEYIISQSKMIILLRD